MSSKDRGELTVLADTRTIKAIGAKLSRRQALIGLGLGSAAVLTAAACGTSGPQQSQGSATADLSGQPLEKELVLANFTDYISQANVQAFTLAAGPTVKLVSYSTGQEMISKLAAGTADYDIVVPGPSETAQLKERNLLRPLDKALIPNIANVRPEVMNPSFDPGNEFTVPKAIGVASFWYNTETVKGRATSLAEAFDMIKANPNVKVNFFGGAKETFTIALAAVGKPIDSTDPADIEAAKQLLISVKPFVNSYGSDELEGGASGSIDICMGYNYTAKQINSQAKRPLVQFVLPETGSTEYFIDNWAIAAAAKNPVAAHKFIDWISAPEQAGKEMDSIGTLVPIKGIDPFVTPALIADPTINVPSDRLKQYEILVATPEYLEVVTKAYDEFRAA